MNGSTPRQGFSERQRARIIEAKEVFSKFPDAVTKELQLKVLEQQVEVGMDPYMAKLAGGECFFKIHADPARWSAGTNPEVVMDAQSLRPDASEIWLTFENDTQFPGSGSTKFRVFIINGRVKSIEPL